MKHHTLIYAVLVLTTLNINVYSQLAPPIVDEEVGFSVVNDKFIRNLKTLIPLIDEEEAKQKMNSLVGQVSGLNRFYQSKNADSQRENILKKSEDALDKTSLRTGDFERMDKLKKALKKRDPDNQFNTATQQVLLTSEALNKVLDQIYTNDNKQKDLIRMAKKHVQMYRSAINKVRQGLSL